ncbi:MAG: acyltransferase [Bacteroidetes bacterium]|nr:MAG: acyltransferase [Bacteroidota bacterium]REK08191.1 MAG: acyltransferase [Bacteroidota bacterium]REK32396.1 MAG: acyltransferase [Bacteroidota bacterium]REK49619.1 MAG: acyltransferase [Bacteroidota bacterium]
MIFAFIFKILGWKIEGDVPRDIPKYLIIVAPHTSNWDFFVGLAVRSILKFPSRYLAKKELFIPPFGWIFRKLGGYPVDRSKSTNMVDDVVSIFKKEDSFILAITPEGTRKNVRRWKTGFYHIAVKAGIPIVLSGIDYKLKKVVFSKPMNPCGELEKDAVIIDKFFETFSGKNGNAAKVLGNAQTI